MRTWSTTGSWLCAAISVVACADAPRNGDASEAAATYAAVAEIVHKSCSYSRCHAGSVVGAGLLFDGTSDFAAALVDVPACEYDGMKRVEPFEPERSWLMVKLTANVRDRDDAYANYIYFDAGPDWDPERRGCRDQTDDGTPLFGVRMPSTAPNMLQPPEIETIRTWILEGATRPRANE